jgi:uncharacterized membrane protein YdfJ with MMPL/SSD domain
MNRTSRTRSTLFARRTLLAFTAVAALGTFTPLRAEPPVEPQGAVAAKDESKQAAIELRDEFMELQRRLSSIQEKAVKEHPELQKQMKDLEELMMDKLSNSSGKNMRDELAEIGKLEQKLRSNDLPENEREELMVQYQKKTKAFHQVQMEVQQDPQVKKAQTDLMDATLAAMKETDPETEQLVQQMQQTQERMRQMIESGSHAQ